MTKYFSSTIPAGGLTGSYTFTNSNGTSATDFGQWSVSANPVTITQKATIDLKGEEADIVINGESLKETLQSIKEALRIPGKLRQDEKLEQDFEELKAIREKYERMVKEYKEKQKVWSTLKDSNL